MLHGRRLTTLVIIVVLLNPSRIDSELRRATRDSDRDGDLKRQATQHSDETKLKNDVAAAFEHAQHHHLHEGQLQEKPVIHHAEEPGQENKEHDESSIEDESNPEKDGEIHVEESDRHVREDDEEDEGYSGDESHIDATDIHYHIHKSDIPGENTLKQRKKIEPDDEEGDIENSGEGSDREELHVHHQETRDFNTDHHPVDDEDAKSDWEHFQMHLHAHGKEDGEFGYITDEDESDPEYNDDDESLSGEQDYDHEHIKTLHVHRSAKHVKYPRDSHVVGRIEQEIAGEEDGEDVEQSGEEELESVYDRRDLEKFDADSESGEREVSLLSEDETDLSGEEELSERDLEKIPEDNDKDEDSETENTSKESEGGGEEKIQEDNNLEPDSKAKNTKKIIIKFGNKRKIPKNKIIEKKKILQNRKSSSGKKKRPSVDNQVSHQTNKLKVHAEIDLTHQKSHISPKGKTNNKVKSRPSDALKALKNQMIRDVESRNGQDFYIDENEEPEQRMLEVEMRNIEDGKDHSGTTDTGNRKIKKRAKTEDGAAESIQDFRRGRHLLQFSNRSDPFVGVVPWPPVPLTHCTHQALSDHITDQTIVYIRTECRLCQCRMGELVCEPKQEPCDQHLAKPCLMAKGQLADGGRHFDGCNNCVCRNGELLCTRVRCASSRYNYTNYQENSDSKNTMENSLMAILQEGPLVRGRDPCMECDMEPVESVCGPNWKTYRSMCHALECGGFKVDDVKQGKCESLNPCDEAKCAAHEICIVDGRGPCLASTTRDGNNIECPQHQCVSLRENCSFAHVEKMCGEDHNIYMTTCSMFNRGVALAYYGPCREECLKDDAMMCGADGVTFKSICHASLHNSYVDYPGQCDEVDPKNNYFMNNRTFQGYYNRRCKTVTELARCPAADCEYRVIPEGSCCPVCGTTVSIRLDTAARDMISLTAKVQPPEDLNRLDAIFTVLKNLSDQFGGKDDCQLTTDLVDTHDISVIYKPITSQGDDACRQAALKTVAFINSPAKSDLEPAKALLAAAVINDRPEATGLPRALPVMAKRRKKRGEHHEHEPFNNKSDRTRLQTNLLLSLVVLSLYWFTNLTQF